MDCSTSGFRVHPQLLKSIASVMPSNHLILCRPLLLLPSVFPSIRVFSNQSIFCIRWPKYWRFSINPSNEYSGLRLTSLISLLTRRLSRIFSSTTVQKHQFFRAQLPLRSRRSHPYMTTGKTIALTRQTRAEAIQKCGNTSS